MKKHEIDYIKSLLRHVELLLPLLPRHVDGGKYPTKICNARRLLPKDIARVKRIIEKLYEDVHTENNASAG